MGYSRLARPQFYRRKGLPVGSGHAALFRPSAAAGKFPPRIREGLRAAKMSIEHRDDDALSAADVTEPILVLVLR